MLLARWILAAFAARAAPSDDPASARARSDGLALTWEAPAECGDEQAFLEHLSRLWGHELRLDPYADVHVAIAIQAEKPGYALRIHMDGPGMDDRDLWGSSCLEVLDAASLVVVTRLATIRESFVGSPPVTHAETHGGLEPPGERVPEPPFGSVAESSLERAVEPVERAAEPAAGLVTHDAARTGSRPARPRPRVYGLTGLVAGPAFRVGPNWTGVISLYLGLGTTRVRGELVGTYVFAKDAPAIEGVVPRISVASLGLRGCWSPGIPEAKISFPLCVGAAGGIAIAAPDRTLNDARRGYQPWGGVSGELGLVWMFRPRLALRLNTALVGVWRRPRFYVEENGRATTVYRTSPLGGMFVAGLEVHFLAKTRVRGGA